MFKLTKQRDLWPDGANKYSVDNELLAGCMGGYITPTCIKEKIAGTSWRFVSFGEGKGVGSAMLTYFVSHALNLHRFPFCMDRTQVETDSLPEVLTQAFRELANSDEHAEIIAETRAIYDHTQRELTKAGVARVTLKRNICVFDSGENDFDSDYMSGLFRYLEALKFLGKDAAIFEMDVINSFTDSHSTYGSKEDIALFLEVPKEDVFYCADLLCSPHEHSSGFIEPEEWIVLNRSYDGLVHIPVDWIKLNYDRLTSHKKVSKISDAQRIIKEFEPLRLRSRPYQREGSKYLSDRMKLKPSLRTRIGLKLLRR